MLGASLSGSRARLVVALTLTLVAGLISPSRLLASGPDTSAFTVGTAGCGDVAYDLAKDDPRSPSEANDTAAQGCEGWDDHMPFGARAWEFHDKRDASASTPTGIGMTQAVSNDTSFAVDLDDSGAFSSAIIAIDLRSEVGAGGTARTRQNFSIGFDTDAGSLMLAGTGVGEHAGGDGPEGGAGFGTIRLDLVCGPAPDTENHGILQFDVHHAITADHLADTVEQQPLEGVVATGGGPCLITGDVAAEALVTKARAGDHAVVHEQLQIQIIAGAPSCDPGGAVPADPGSSMPTIPVAPCPGSSPGGS